MYVIFRIKIHGKENFPIEGAVIVAFNHRSYWDVPLTATVLPRKLTFMAKKEQKRALELYADLLLLKEAPIRILFMMARQYNQMLLCKDLLKEGKGNKEIALLLSVRDFVVPRLAGIVKNYTREEIKKCVELCVDTENAIKTGNVNDQIGVEMAIVELSK